MMPIITIIGPYDYGKSTLLGNLLLKTGSIPKNMVKNVKAQCLKSGVEFHPSYIMDHIREERDMKSTRERALAELKVGKQQILVIDTPGQLALSRKMISGLTEANIVVLMLDIQDEAVGRYAFYFKLISLLNIENVILAVNKMDTAEYSQKKYKNFLSRISKYCELKQKYYILPIAALSGDNLVEASESMPWFKGDSLFAYLKKIVRQQKDSAKEKFIMSVQSVLKREDNFIALGKITQGMLKSAEKIKLVSGSLIEEAEIKALYNNGKKTKKSFENDNVGVILSSRKKIKRGDLLIGKNAGVHFGRKIKAWLFVAKDFNYRCKRLAMLIFTDKQKINEIKIKKQLDFQQNVKLSNVSGSTGELKQNEFAEVEIVLEKEVAFCNEINPIKIAIIESGSSILAIGEIIKK